MITKLGCAIVKEAKNVEDAMNFVTECIRHPAHPQLLFIPPTRKKKVDENGNILKPLAGMVDKGEFFGKWRGK